MKRNILLCTSRFKGTFNTILLERRLHSLESTKVRSLYGGMLKEFEKKTNENQQYPAALERDTFTLFNIIIIQRVEKRDPRGKKKIVWNILVCQNFFFLKSATRREMRDSVRAPKIYFLTEFNRNLLNIIERRDCCFEWILELIYIL